MYTTNLPGAFHFILFLVPEKRACMSRHNISYHMYLFFYSTAQCTEYIIIIQSIISAGLYALIDIMRYFRRVCLFPFWFVFDSFICIVDLDLHCTLEYTLVEFVYIIVVCCILFYCIAYHTHVYKIQTASLLILLRTSMSSYQLTYITMPGTGTEHRLNDLSVCAWVTMHAYFVHTTHAWL